MALSPQAATTIYFGALAMSSPNSLRHTSPRTPPTTTTFSAYHGPNGGSGGAVFGQTQRRIEKTRRRMAARTHHILRSPRLPHRRDAEDRTASVSIYVRAHDACQAHHAAGHGVE
ncbi:hypothetical protein PLICRDRAFT_55056 [Plicaturopsis crispa FD-325 SS-3]|nr:hypothetical protein PLICRDRAFT_55056 [Plicaturopsis crispa FD-325 SS-3]